MKRLFTFFLISFLSLSIQAQTWNTVSPPTLGTPQTILSTGSELWITTAAAGPHVSTDGSNWTAKASGLTGAAPQGAGLAVINNEIFYGSKGGVHKSTDGGNSWTDIDSGLSITAINYVNFFHEYDGVIFAVTSAARSNSGGLFRWNGVSWDTSMTGMPPNVTAMQVAKSGSKLFCGTNLGLFESTDTGKTWLSVSSGAPSGPHYGTFEKDGRLITSTLLEIRFSDDGGATWSTSTNSPGAGTKVGFLAGSNDTIYCWSVGNGVFASGDTGRSWVDISGNMSSIEKISVSGLAEFNGNLYQSTFLAVKRRGNASTGGIGPRIEVRRNGVAINPASNQDFDSTIVGQTSAAESFTILNTGDTILVLIANPSVTLGGSGANSFNVNFPVGSKEINPGDSIVFTATFSPSSAGQVSATASIPNSDPNQAAFVFSFRGVGIPDQTSVGELNLNSLRIFPNPMSDLLKVEGIQVKELKVFDMSGRLITKGDHNLLDVSELKGGTYILEVIDNAGQSFRCTVIK